MTRPKTILIVEDEESIRSFVKAYLESEGYIVLEAENGQQGLEVLSQHKPDLIVTDIMMPIMDGIEFFKQIRTMPEFSTIPVIMLTVKDAFNDIKYAYLLGVEEYITKPFEPSILVNRIKEMVQEVSSN